MKRPLGNSEQGRRPAEATRKQLIKREMRFVLQQDVRRFTKQLLSHLLDEGCNLHPDLARIMFYEGFQLRLSTGRTIELRARFCGLIPDLDAGCTHPQYYAAVKCFLARRSDAATHIAAAVLDTIETLKQEWQRIAIKCLSNSNPADPCLPGLIEQIVRMNPEGKLARHDLDRVRRRLKIAVVTTLMRHVRKPELLRKKYGSVPLMLQAIGRNQTLLPAVLTTFEEQIPFAQHVIARSFWRTLNNMDTEWLGLDIGEGN